MVAYCAWAAPSTGEQPLSARFHFRPLTHSDLPLLHEWLNRPHVAQWWQGAVSLEVVVEEYGAEIDSPLVQQMLACLEGEPVGFIQSYSVLGADPEWWTDEIEPGARGIDQFLANAAQLGHGLGTQMVQQFVAQLFEDPRVTRVQTDPAPNNARAIRAYEKAGFQRVREIKTPDGAALLMVIERPATNG